MYCPSCGTAHQQEPSYCNRCGSQLALAKAGETPKSIEKSIETTIWSVAGVTISMLGIMIALLSLMKGFDISSESVVLFIALMFLILLGVDGIFIWQLRRLHNLAKREARREWAVRGNPPTGEQYDTKELDAGPQRALFEPGMSVVEGPTRKFEPSYKEHRTK